MTIEVAMLISGISVAFGIYAGIANLKRNVKQDAKTDATQLTTVIVKLENISDGIIEIKNEISNVKAEVKESREKLARLDEQVKQAHKRIDEITKKGVANL